MDTSYSKYDPEQTKRSTMLLLRTIIMISQTLKPVPENAQMSMKIEYNELVHASESYMIDYIR